MPKPKQVDVSPYAASFKTQKPITKAQALKLREADVVEVKWQDGPNTRAVVTERADRRDKVAYLRVLDLACCDVRTLDYLQIVSRVGRINPYGELILVNSL